MGWVGRSKSEFLKLVRSADVSQKQAEHVINMLTDVLKEESGD